MGDHIAGEEAPAPQLSRAQLRRGDSGTSPDASFRPRTEHTREREALQHLHSWISLNSPVAINRNAFPVTSADDEKPLPAPEPCSDPTLAAFAQLCALRMKARRVLLTVMPGSVEYVLSEATRTMTLQTYNHVEDEKDRLWLGTCSFPLACGVNGLALEGWRKARSLREMPKDPEYYYQEGRSAHWFIISDAQNNQEFNHIAFIQRAPALRFFCSVPIRSIDGTVIGSLSVLDDKPRYGVSANEMALIEDTGGAIAEHLESCIVRSQRQRSARLIQALGLFNSMKGSLRDWWFAQDNDRITRGGRHGKTTEDSKEQKNRADEEFGVQDPELSDSTVSSRRQLRRGNSPETNEMFGSQDATNGNNAAMGDRDTRGIVTQDFDCRPSADPGETPRFVGDDSAITPVDETFGSSPVRQRSPSAETLSQRRESFDLASASKDAFARATNLLREALNAEAVVCVDAQVASSKLRNTSKGDRDASSGETGSSATSLGLKETIGHSTSDTDLSDTAASVSKNCKVTGFSTRNRSSLTGTRSNRHNFGLTERELQALIKRHPNGKIFNYEENGSLYSSSGDESTSASNEGIIGRGKASNRTPKTKHGREAQRLAKVMIGARTIAFYPIWDDGNNSWRSCIFVWSTTPMRFFDPAETITYLIAFSHSLLAELSRAETLASDYAKATFISSMSHELRSPLHGVLAGIEMIQDSHLNSFQKQMAITVSVAGRVLLDTINHILDYSKISRLTKTQRKEQAKSDASRHNTKLREGVNDSEDSFSIDLCRLTEEIVETAVSGHRYLGLAKGGDSREEQPNREKPNKGVKSSPGALDALSVTLTIQKRDNWNVDITPGAWTRILVNLVGNALKYTREGTVSIELSAGKPKPEDSTSSALVSLRISDTGIGMSQEFLHSGIYTPFKQANSHSTGTGLGLSIVKQICKDLKADLDFESELGRGTTAKLTFRASFDQDVANGNRTLVDEQSNKSLADLPVRNFRMLTLGSQLEPSESPALAPLANSVARAAVDWLDCDYSTGLNLDGLDGKAANTACAILESDLIDLGQTKPDLLNGLLSSIAAKKLQMLVLGSSIGMGSELSFEGIPVRPIYVSQPIGPRKLLRALTGAEDPIKQHSLRSHAMPEAKTPLVFAAGGHHNGSANSERSDSFPWGAGSSTGSQGPSESAQSLSLRPQSTRRKSSQTRTPTANPKVTSSTPPFSLVTRNSAGSSADGSDEPAEKTAPNEQRVKVLLVEDNDVNMKILAALMRKLKIPYECASNGQEAFDIFCAAPTEFKLVIMDLDMPILDGHGSSRKIRDFERRHHLPRTFIVALTGVTSAEVKNASVRSGMDRFHSKPILMKDLSILIAEVSGEGKRTGS